MPGLLYEYVWKCGDLAGHQFIRSLSMSNNRKWFLFQDISTGEKIMIHHDQYHSFTWKNDGIQCFYTIKLIEDYAKQANSEGHTATQQSEEPE